MDNQFRMQLFETHKDIDEHVHSGFKIEGSVFPKVVFKITLLVERHEDGNAFFCIFMAEALDDVR